jgi:hypothetical protein
MKKAYSFMESTKTSEKHIFEGEFTTDTCNAENKCICKKMEKSQGSWINMATCLDEQKAREKAAIIGRDVCGDCVSHLYKSY